MNENRYLKETKMFSNRSLALAINKLIFSYFNK